MASRRGILRLFRCCLAAVVSAALPACSDPSVSRPGLDLKEPAAAGAARTVSPELAEFMAVARHLEDRNALFVGGSRVEQLQRKLKAAPRGTALEVDARLFLGNELLRLGESAAALDQYRHALELERSLGPAVRGGQAAPSGSGNPRGTAPSQHGKGNDTAAADRQRQRIRTLLFKLIIASMRVGEQENCVSRHGPMSCILPIHAGGVHHRPAGARGAMQYAMEYLALYPEDVKAIWFLNLAAMLADDYPEGVPARFRIPAARFRSKMEMVPFLDVAPHLGVDTWNEAGGSLAADLDGDDLIDLLTSTMDPRGPLTFLHNNGDGTFEDRTAVAGLDSQLGGLNLSLTDYDNDGDIDILVLRGGWLEGEGHIRNSLLANDGSGRFTDVTRRAGLARPALPTQTGVWADYDGDGDLDLFVGNEGERRAEGMRFFDDNLFRNNGDGTFTDVAEEAGVANHRWVKGAAWGDFDNDGDPDLYVSNIGPNRLYRNNGDGTFKDIAGELGVTEPVGRSFGTWFFDYDNDGDLDLFVIAYLAGMKDIAADIMGRTKGDPRSWPRLYRNDGGRFTDVTVSAGLDHPHLPMGASFGDINEDGYPDIYLGTGAPAYEAFMPNVMYLNNKDGTFTDITFTAGFGHLQKGHGISFADFDNDGDRDVALQAGGMFPGDRFANALFENPGHGHHFLWLKLIGVRSNRAALGTRFHVQVTTPHGPGRLYGRVATGGSFGASPLRQFLGLGDATGIARLEITWPASGRRQRFDNLPLDRLITIVEDKDRFAATRLAAFRLAPDRTDTAVKNETGGLPGPSPP
ncbi:MAG: FG-GAP-like repeat-containing protein [Acidobacteriota bacterium]